MERDRGMPYEEVAGFADSSHRYLLWPDYLSKVQCENGSSLGDSLYWMASHQCEKKLKTVYHPYIYISLFLPGLR